ncbi:hypothetical protein FA95DRAFT_1576958 [Auriscalpium vulgare]|uniref:Uncharacterized protein n=1 Tax=Auriscalpium vulgare TaxID=40419 RepID=A0ACB8R8U8_9AGAM|nr:hypothetical protein FA95DRAFT_1576958 [Auriscalpium vulgare]
MQTASIGLLNSSPLSLLLRLTPSVNGELAEAQGGAAALSHENDKLRGELYQALHDARVSAAEQDASLSMVNAQLLIVQKELAETKRQAAEEVEALEALLVQEDARSNTALATIGGADNAFVEDLAFTVDPQVPDMMPKELGPTEVRDGLPECPSTPPVARRIAHSPCTQPSSCSSPSSYSAGPSPWVGRMTALFPELYDYDPSFHPSPSTDSDDLFGPSAPANFNCCVKFDQWTSRTDRRQAKPS